MFKEVASLDADVTIAVGKVNKKTGKKYPSTAEGYYLGSRQVKGDRAPSTLHFLQTPDGNLGIWGTTDLNRKITGVAAGTMIRITFTGKKPTPKGDMYCYKVETDTDNTIEVSADITSDDTAYAAADEDDTTETEEETTEAEEEYEAPVAKAKPSLVASAADRKAKVEALLAQGRKK